MKVSQQETTFFLPYNEGKSHGKRENACRSMQVTLFKSLFETVILLLHEILHFPLDSPIGRDIMALSAGSADREDRPDTIGQHVGHIYGDSHRVSNRPSSSVSLAICTCSNVVRFVGLTSCFIAGCGLYLDI